MSPKERRNAVLRSARQIAEQAKTDERNFTQDERAEIDSLLAQAEELRKHIQQAEHDQAQLRQIGSVGQNDSSPDPTGEHPSGARLTLASLKSAANLLTAKMTTPTATGAKALLPSGTAVTAIPMAANVVATGRPPAGLLELLPTVSGETQYAYLRQTTRTNAAAPVVPGATKPTSTYGLERVEDRLRVVAHLSEAIDRFWLADNTSLRRFVADELLHGLYRAVEAQVLTGDGLGENLTGLANTSGVQIQAFTTSAMLTARTALTKVESLGYDGAAYVLHPSDWEGIETAPLSAGHYPQPGDGVPVDRAARRLWGQPVALSPGLPVGTGYLLGNQALALNTDRNGIVVDWSANVADDFARNQFRARCEGRFGLSVYQPAAVVRMSLIAT